MRSLKFERGFGGMVGCLATIVGYVVIALNAPWFVTAIAILLSLRWSVSTDIQESADG